MSVHVSVQVCVLHIIYVTAAVSQLLSSFPESLSQRLPGYRRTVKVSYRASISVDGWVSIFIQLQNERTNKCVFVWTAADRSAIGHPAGHTHTYSPCAWTRAHAVGHCEPTRPWNNANGLGAKTGCVTHLQISSHLPKDPAHRCVITSPPGRRDEGMISAWN